MSACLHAHVCVPVRATYAHTCVRIMQAYTRNNARTPTRKHSYVHTDTDTHVRHRAHMCMYNTMYVRLDTTQVLYRVLYLSCACRYALLDFRFRFSQLFAVVVSATILSTVTSMGDRTGLMFWCLDACRERASDCNARCVDNGDPKMCTLPCNAAAQRCREDCRNGRWFKKQH